MLVWTSRCMIKPQSLKRFKTMPKLKFGLIYNIMKLKQAYFEPFFVGLFEGDGSLHMGRTKHGKNKPSLSYPVAQISLKDKPENKTMLDLVAFHFGGHVSPERKTLKIKWTANSQASIRKILDVFQRYPLLTSGKICQLKHARACLNDRSWSYHELHRNHKYAVQPKLVQDFKTHFEVPAYFPAWLSGFFEAEGSFRCSHRLSVYISQNNDWYLLHAIKAYFNSHHSLNRHKDLRSPAKLAKLHYRLSMSGKPVLNNVLSHFKRYPLLGFKKVSYDAFVLQYYKNHNV